MPPKGLLQETEMRMESRQVSRFKGLRIHFIGIAGCGMCGLARMLHDAGAIVTGSDLKLTPQIQQLQDEDVEISFVQDGGLLDADVDLVVRTAAIPASNAEYRKALELGLPQLKYAQLLGQVMAERFGIAVSGTHGKSTTTAMIAYAMLKCGEDPSFVIGGTVQQLGGSSRSGKGKAFVVEACEFDRSFHNLHPTVAIITNIEKDHTDCYTGGIREIIESFRQFARLVPARGRIIANGLDLRVRRALRDFRTPIEWFGIQERPSLTWSTRVLGHEGGCYRGEILHNGRHAATIQLSLAGVHNLYNATAAVAACHMSGVNAQEAADALAGFRGVDRRMSEVGTFHGAMVVDDYGHHPTEIRTTLRAIRERYNPRRLICVFQPHQYSRTRSLLEEFGQSFGDADLTIVPDIYAARDTEADRKSVRTADLVQRIQHNGRPAMYIAQLPAIVSYLGHAVREGNLIVTMGAGNICEVGRDLVAG